MPKITVPHGDIDPDVAATITQPLLAVDEAEAKKLANEFASKTQAALQRERDELAPIIAQTSKQLTDNDGDWTKVDAVQGKDGEEKFKDLVVKHTRLTAVNQAIAHKRAVLATLDQTVRGDEALPAYEEPHNQSIHGLLMDGLREQGHNTDGPIEVPQGQRWTVALTPEQADGVLGAVFRSDRSGGSGYQPYAIPRPGVVLSRTEALTFLDLVPTRMTNQSAEIANVEKTFTDTNVVEKAEGAAAGDVTLKVEQETFPLSLVPAWIGVTGTQLEDIPGSRGYLDGRLERAVQGRVVKQAVVGNGTAPNLKGLLAYTGVNEQTSSVGGNKLIQDLIDAALSTLGGYEDQDPSGVYIHPGAFAQACKQDSNGAGQGFYLGSAQDGFVPRILGLPVAVGRGGLAWSAANDIGAIIGDFQMYSYFAVRREFSIVVGWQADDLIKDQQTLYGAVRVAFVCTRESAFTKIKRVA